MHVNDLASHPEEMSAPGSRPDAAGAGNASSAANACATGSSMANVLQRSPSRARFGDKVTDASSSALYRSPSSSRPQHASSKRFGRQHSGGGQMLSGQDRCAAMLTCSLEERAPTSCVHVLFRACIAVDNAWPIPWRHI